MVGGLTVALLTLWFMASSDAAVGGGLRSDPAALRLLSRSARAAEDTPYQGLQFLTAWNSDGTAVTSVVKVSHEPGVGTDMVVETTTAEQGGTIFQADNGGPRGGLTGYSARMLGLLTANYSVVESGSDEVAGRPVTVIEARRSDGSVAGRFFIDQATGMMLRREVLDDSGREVDLMMFSDYATAPSMKVTVTASDASVQAPWNDRLGAADLRALEDHGWPIHPELPGPLSLYGAYEPRGKDPVVQLGYSDGLSSVSVFMQRGTLNAAAVTGWQRVRRAGRDVYLSDTMQQMIICTGAGYVYTIIADAPPATVDSVITALPAPTGGFWDRMGRGLERLLHLGHPSH
jgi:sigma-E factor negative regulatory protein RseB